MRLVLALIALAGTALARDPSAAASAQSACGPEDVNFDVQREPAPPGTSAPQAGKALVYVIQDKGTAGGFTAKIALDGAWVGAIRNNSYVAFPVNPGEHHFCARMQSRLGFMKQLAGLLHFTAEPGKIYYLRTRILTGFNQLLFDFEPIDSDQGKFYIAEDLVSVSHIKK